MTDLRFRRAIPTATPDPNRPSWCEADETAAVGTITVRPYARQHETTPGHRVVLPGVLKLPLVNGEATLANAEPGYLIVKEDGIAQGRRDGWIILVPDVVGVVDDCDLPAIDPATLTPEAAPEAAWWTALQAVIDAGGATPEQIGEAVEAYLTANPPPVGVTPAELAAAIATRAAAVHNHDDRYYTETESDGRYATSAQGTKADSASQPGHAHTLDAVTDTASRVAMLPTERTKLTGVSTGATANATDAQLRDRGTHTGTQAIATVTGLQTALDGKAAGDHAHDARYVRTVNGTGPDGAGNVVVSGGAGSLSADDTPAVPAEGQSAAYFVTSAVSWPSGLVWSTDPDGGVAPTITGTALVSMFTLDGVTRAVLGAMFPTPPDTTAPSVPTSLSATAASATSVTLAWTASTDAVGVTGYEYRIGAGSAVDCGVGVTETVTGLTPETVYAFSVRAYDAAGNRSGWSTSASATTPAMPVDTTPPTAGTLAGSSVTSSGFTLTVTGASDAGAGLHATPYRFSTDDGVTYSAWQASASLAVTGLSASTGYVCKHQVRDAATTPNVATGSAVTVTTSASVTSLASAIAALGPVGYWKLDEATGTMAADSSGNGRHGTYSGTVTLANQDGFPTFDGGVVTVPDSDALSANTSGNGLSIFALLRQTDTTGERRIIGKLDPYEYALEATAATLRGVVWHGGGSGDLMKDMSGEVLSTNTWQAVAMAAPHPATAARIALYRNSGTPLSTTQGSTSSGTYANGSTPLRIGNSLAGSLGHVAVFPTQLTDAQVQGLVDAARSQGLIP